MVLKPPLYFHTWYFSHVKLPASTPNPQDHWERMYIWTMCISHTASLDVLYILGALYLIVKWMNNFLPSSSYHLNADMLKNHISELYSISFFIFHWFLWFQWSCQCEISNPRTGWYHSDPHLHFQHYAKHLCLEGFSTSQMCAELLSHVQHFATPWTKAPRLALGCSRQEY